MAVMERPRCPGHVKKHASISIISANRFYKAMKGVHENLRTIPKNWGKFLEPLGFEFREKPKLMRLLKIPDRLFLSRTSRFA